MEHMATPEHKKKTHKFWWDNKADPKFRDKVIITEEETERFKNEVANALESFVEKEDEFIKQVTQQTNLVTTGRTCTPAQPCLKPDMNVSMLTCSQDRHKLTC